MGTPWGRPARHTLGGVLDAQAEVRPDQVCSHIADEPITYRQLVERSTAAANVMAELGVRSGDSVAVYMTTSPEWLYAWFGASRLGAVTVPINVAYRGDFLANQLCDSGATAIVTEAALLDRLAGVAGDAPDLGTVLVRPGDGEPARTDGLPPRLSVHPTTVLLEGDTGIVKADGGAVWNRPGAIFYTSGTTGPSKGAVVTQHYLVSAAATALSCWGLEPGEAVWGPLPLFHLSAIGTVLAPILAGGTGVVDRAFSVQAAWDQVRRFDAAGVVLAGAMVMMLWSLPPDASDGDLPFRFLSAAPVPREVYRGVEERYHCKVVTMYGLTEAFPLTFAGVADDNPPGASGRPNPAFEVALFDDEDVEVPVGDVGQIVCRPRSPHVMFEGYFGRDQATVAQCRDLWFHTGDLGRFDEDGNLYYVDRQKDHLRRRGENISSFEVEQALLQHPAVAEIAAIGVPSDVGEDDVMVCVVTAPGAELDPVDLLDFACDRLPYFAVPRFVEVCAELPKNAVGRVLKPVLRERGSTDATWDREQVGYVVRR